LVAWVGQTAFFQSQLATVGDAATTQEAVEQLLAELVRSGAAQWDGDCVENR